MEKFNRENVGESTGRIRDINVFSVRISYRKGEKVSNYTIFVASIVHIAFGETRETL